MDGCGVQARMWRLGWVQRGSLNAAPHHPLVKAAQSIIRHSPGIRRYEHYCLGDKLVTTRLHVTANSRGRAGASSRQLRSYACGWVKPANHLAAPSRQPRLSPPLCVFPSPTLPQLGLYKLCTRMSRLVKMAGDFFFNNPPPSPQGLHYTTPSLPLKC